MTNRLFVYGTLAPGRSAWSVIAAWATGTPSEDRVAGALYDTGRGYPAAVFDGPGETVDTGNAVHGYVVELDPAGAAEAFTTLDRYEGPEYERTVVRTERGVEVATYAWIAPLAGCRPVPGGRWEEG